MRSIYSLGFFLPRRRRWILPLVFFSLVIYFVLKILVDLQGLIHGKPVYSALSKDDLGIDKCPVCFGLNKSLCEKLSSGYIKVLKNPWALSENAKGVIHGMWNGTKVVVKSNANEFKKLDTEICSSLGMINDSCDLQKVAKQSFLNPKPSLKSILKANMDCPSDRLISQITSHYTRSEDNMTQNNMIHLTTTVFFNHEPIILQVFPAEYGWPFPKFYGACGRAIVVEDVGKTLDMYLTKSWSVRVTLALSVLELAHRLTLSEHGWALYMSDPFMENFAVAEDLEVKLIDAEHLVVVDLWTIPSQQEPDEEQVEDRCPPNEPRCLFFRPDDLCSGRNRDHNYYAVCRGILADVAERRGLLHSPPPSLETVGKTLKELLSDCVSGHKSRREDTVAELENILLSQFYTETN